MDNNKYEKSVSLFCQCILDEDSNSADYMGISEKDKRFIEFYTDNYSTELFETTWYTPLLLKEIVRQCTAQYCLRKFSKKEPPFDFLNESSLDAHLSELQRACFERDCSKPLHSIFLNDIVELIRIEKLYFENTNVQITAQIKNYHSVVDPSQTKEFEKQKKEIQSLNESLKSTIAETDKHYNSLNNKIKNYEKKTYENCITILGIFSAAVLAFNVATGFYSSILEAFTSSSMYKILLILLIVGLIVTCALLSLFYYLEAIRNHVRPTGAVATSKPLDQTSTASDDSSLATPATPDDTSATKGKLKEVIMRFLKRRRVASISNPFVLKKFFNKARPLAPFLITLCVLLFLIVGVVVSWLSGLVEWRNIKIKEAIKSAATSQVEIIASDTNTQMNFVAPT